MEGFQKSAMPLSNGDERVDIISTGKKLPIMLFMAVAAPIVNQVFQAIPEILESFIKQCGDMMEASVKEVFDKGK